jgi:hypothetical protein
MEMFRLKLENWYDSNMERITGTMKVLHTNKIITIASIVITILLNADTIAISKYLYNNEDARAQIASKAYETSTDKKIEEDMNRLRSMPVTNDSMKLTLNQLQDSLNAKLKTINTAHAALKESIPLGWRATEFSGGKALYEWILYVLFKIIGLIITILALMMGAPFWFDILKKVSNIRGTGPRPAAASEDSDKKIK